MNRRILIGIVCALAACLAANTERSRRRRARKIKEEKGAGAANEPETTDSLSVIESS